MKVENVVIKKIHETKEVGSNNFKIRELWVQTQEQYPQTLNIQFTGNNCVFLDNFTEGEIVNIDINLRGRGWTNSEGVEMVFNTLNGWKINLSENTTNSAVDAYKEQAGTKEKFDLPF